jgi:membrane protease subunit HflC
MKEERQREVQRLQAEGDARARNIRTAANRDATNTISKAEAKVIEIRGQAEAEADRALKVFEQNPELAIFLLKINALEESSRGRPPTLILNQRTPIYDMIDAAPKGAPLNPPNKK